MGWILTLLLQDKYDGWGEAFYLNGSVYVGCWQLGKRTGFGISKHFRSNGDCKEIYTGKYLPIPIRYYPSVPKKYTLVNTY